MRRREFIAGLGAAAAIPPAVRAQQTAIPVVGFLGAETHDRQTARFRGFHQGLSESGYAEGRNVTIEYRWSGGHAAAAEPPKMPRKSRRLMSAPKSEDGIVSAQRSTLIGAENGFATAT